MTKWAKEQCRRFSHTYKRKFADPKTAICFDLHGDS